MIPASYSIRSKTPGLSRGGEMNSLGTSDQPDSNGQQKLERDIAALH